MIAVARVNDLPARPLACDKNARLLLGVASVVFLATGAACGGPPARAPGGASGALPHEFAEAFRVDATGEPHAAVGAYLAAARDAAQAGGDPWQVAALEASLDALDTRSMPSLGDAASDVVTRVPHGRGDRDRRGARPRRERRARTLRARARGPGTRHPRGASWRRGRGGEATRGQRLRP